MSSKTVLPHSWALKDWPSDVYPGSVDRAKYVVRANRDELTRDGVLSRVGRELVVIGSRYSRWLEKGNANVAGWEVPANRSRAMRAA